MVGRCIDEERTMREKYLQMELSRREEAHECDVSERRDNVSELRQIINKESTANAEVESQFARTFEDIEARQCDETHAMVVRCIDEERTMQKEFLQMELLRREEAHECAVSELRDNMSQLRQLIDKESAANAEVESQLARRVEGDQERLSERLEVVREDLLTLLREGFEKETNLREEFVDGESRWRDETHAMAGRCIDEERTMREELPQMELSRREEAHECDVSKLRDNVSELRQMINKESTANAEVESQFARTFEDIESRQCDETHAMVVRCIVRRRMSVMP